MNSRFPQIIKGILFESLIWFFPAGLFLLIYIIKFDASTAAIASHLFVVSLFAIASCCFRYCFVRWAEKLLFLYVAVVSCLLLILTIYYVVVIIGLSSWGRVISIQLMSTYLNQMEFFLSSININPLAVISGVLVMVVVYYIAIYYLFSRHDWLPFIAKYGSNGFSVIILAAISFLIFLSLYNFVSFPPIDAGEPFSLTLNPEINQSRIQTNKRPVSKKLDEEEESVRATYSSQKAENTPNVILIISDSLRANHLSFNGYDRVTMPYLKALSESVGFFNTSAMHGVCAESSCGLLGLMSSRHIYNLPSKPITLQEVLAMHGYKTHMIISGDHSNFYGMRSTYGQLDSYFDGSMTDSFYMNDDKLIVNELNKFPKFDDTPAFFQFRLMSTHLLGRTPSSNTHFQPAERYHFGFEFKEVDSDTMRKFSNYYDNGILDADAIIRSILQTLKSKGYLENAVVTVTADHGELIGEHGLYTHARTVYEEVLNIPFMLFRFGYGSKQSFNSSLLASQIDIAPTVLYELGISPPSSWSGQALQTLHEVGRPRYIAFQSGPEYGLIDASNNMVRWKYWVNVKTGQEYAYDLFADPREANNRIQDISPEQKTVWKQNLLELETHVKESLTEF